MITPSLLKQSGLKNRNIGKHLQIHPAGRVVAMMNEKVEGWKGVSQGAYVDDFEDEGITLEGVFIPPSLMLPALPGVGMEHKEMSEKYNYLSAFGVMVIDKTTGRVLKGWKGMNRVLATYFIRKSDTENLKKGIAYLCRIFFAAGAEKAYTGISKMPILYSMDDVDKLLKLKIKPNHLETMAFHPLGSARMAASPEHGAVNKQGETFDVKNLYVADGSVIPTSLGVNPQISIMTISTIIAEGISERLSVNQ